MNAAVLHQFGSPPRFEQFTDPVPIDDEAIVHVRAASLKPVDKQLASGAHFARQHLLPHICGVDGGGCARRWDSRVLRRAARPVRGNG